MTMKRPLAFLLCVLMAAPGCATTGAPRVAPASAPAQRQADRAVLAEYVQSLPPGSAVRIDLANGRVFRGTLMKATSDMVVVQPRTRIPEPPLEIDIDEVLRLTPDTPGGSSIGKAIGIGLAAGGAAALAVFAIIIALLDD